MQNSQCNYILQLNADVTQTLDANRSFARELARTFAARLGKALWLVFPDDAEVSPGRK